MIQRSCLALLCLVGSMGMLVAKEHEQDEKNNNFPLLNQRHRLQPPTRSRTIGSNRKWVHVPRDLDWSLVRDIPTKDTFKSLDTSHVGEALALQIPKEHMELQVDKSNQPTLRRNLNMRPNVKMKIARSCYDPDECDNMIRLYNEGLQGASRDATVNTFDGHNQRSEDIEENPIYHTAFAGMVLQVFKSNDSYRRLIQDNVYKLSARKNDRLPAYGYVEFDDDNYLLNDLVFEQAYKLVEPVHLELGHIPKHALDYAYTPVVIPNEKKERILDEPDCDGPSQLDDEAEEHMDKAVQQKAASSSWWQWWFLSTSTWWKNHGSTESDYDMGTNAFAGGSHGEVWRGRRICKHKRRRRGENTEIPLDGNGKECDEKQPLILKRLKVNRGYRLLEAGLREVYFGNLLREESDSLCTVYVDHFFREIPRAPTFGRRAGAFGKGAKDLELWIVLEDAGPSLRSYLYAPVSTSGGFIMYQHSPLWTQLRMSILTKKASKQDGNSTSWANDENKRITQGNDSTGFGKDRTASTGRALLRDILRQILAAAASLHDGGIVHRDIKPSNVMCISERDLSNWSLADEYPKLECLLGDFSSAWDNFTAQHLYTNGPSPQEQTDEYAPPEARLGPEWVPFHEGRPESYDSWSIGVLALELLLGTPNVFSVDQRTTVLLSNKMKKEGASEDELQRALYLAALSHFCIYVPNSGKSWPLRDGDPLHNTSMVQESCTLQDFHRALRARDPLGTGFDSSADLLLHLIWQLLAWDPLDRITAANALVHPYFDSPVGSKQPLIDLIPGFHNALESQMLDPRLDFNGSDAVHEFTCPKCGRVFSDWGSCQRHAKTRKHAKFCTYDKSGLPACIGTHPMLPAHSTSGFCDLQGRRPTIEDIHSIHLHPSLQFYGIFDGHTGNFASKFVASTLYDTLASGLSNLNQAVSHDKAWKHQVSRSVTEAFADVHEKFLEAVSMVPTVSMDQSGTTATILLATEEAFVVASLGDSRAVLSNARNDDSELTAIQLTKDHVASDPGEQEGVIRRGGFISSSGGIDRVNGTLAITRSIGDADLAPFLSRHPHVVAMSRSEIREQCGVSPEGYSSPCFVIIASDGLWDVMSNQEAVDMVSEVLGSYKYNAYQEAAHALAIEAYVRGSTDNIGVCVVAVE